jgi:hypothetical protein
MFNHMLSVIIFGLQEVPILGRKSLASILAKRVAEKYPIPGIACYFHFEGKRRAVWGQGGFSV